MATQLDGVWPYQREQPDCVVLAPLPGVTPSPLPPVRIFLGTEEGQYRAERVFVWSILQVRDPARTYEVHLMNNVAGFDRRGWRTGFTCYRFAIPDFAGRSGKAIYNDVDQIYLADPALLFDLPMADHGYLAIDARDTSVMLIDCEKMLPWWNRAAASAPGAKGPLTKKPAEVAGLWGELDGHWNARDLEYVEGRTRCLHYTALHQQPWNPFPEDYSYHQNPLAYIWHDLERGADAAGYEVFTREDSSPGFLGILGSNQAVAAGAPPVLSPAARSLLRQTGARSLLVTGIGRLAEVDPGEASLTVRQLDFAQARGRQIHDEDGRGAGAEHLAALAGPQRPVAEAAGPVAGADDEARDLGAGEPAEVLAGAGRIDARHERSSRRDEQRHGDSRQRPGGDELPQVRGEAEPRGRHRAEGEAAQEHGAGVALVGQVSEAEHAEKRRPEQ